MIPSVNQQIKEVEQELRRQAERLGQLNLQNNDQNEKMAQMIVELRNKISKKKHLIEQEYKDKMLIHEKLIKAERQKELLQIQNQVLVQIYPQTRNKKTAKKSQVQLESNNKNHKQSQTKEQQNAYLKSPNEQQLASNLPKSSKQKDFEKQYSKEDQTGNEIRASEQKQEQKGNEHYVETSTSEYQPPILFDEGSQNKEENDDNKQASDEDSEDEDQDILTKLRAKVQNNDED